MVEVSTTALLPAKAALLLVQVPTDLIVIKTEVVHLFVGGVRRRSIVVEEAMVNMTVP